MSQKLAPAHFLIFKNGEIKTEKYWDFKYEKITEVKTEAEYVEKLRELIKEAVKIRLDFRSSARRVSFGRR